MAKREQKTRIIEKTAFEEVFDIEKAEKILAGYPDGHLQKIKELERLNEHKRKVGK